MRAHVVRAVAFGHGVIHSVATALPTAERCRRHRKYFVGALFMVAGSCLAVNSTLIVSGGAAHVAVDVIAYAVHGLGCTPFAHHLIRRFNLEPSDG